LYARRQYLPAIVLPLTAATLAAVSTAAAAAIFLRTGFVDIQCATVELGSVQSVDSTVSLSIATHFDKAEASWLAGIAIGNDADAVNGPICFEQGPKSVFGGGEAEISNKNIFQVRFLLNLQSELIGQIEQRR
jgi:hypothetical protein